MPETTATRDRRRAVHALVAFCAVFFISAVAVSYVVAAHHGYGSGFGDGKLGPVGKPHGHGFVGDAAVLAGAVLIDAAILFAWTWLIPKLEAPTSDDPLPPDDDDDLSRDESWYCIQVPTLTKVLTVIAVFCTVGVALLASSNLPIVLLRFGW